MPPDNLEYADENAVLRHAISDSRVLNRANDPRWAALIAKQAESDQRALNIDDLRSAIDNLRQVERAQAPYIAARRADDAKTRLRNADRTDIPGLSPSDPGQSPSNLFRERLEKGLIAAPTAATLSALAGVAGPALLAPPSSAAGKALVGTLGAALGGVGGEDPYFSALSGLNPAVGAAQVVNAMYRDTPLVPVQDANANWVSPLRALAEAYPQITSVPKLTAYTKSRLPADLLSRGDLVKMSSGSGRIPFALGDDLIVKTARMPRGVQENLLEGEWTAPVPEAVWKSDDDLIAVVKRANPADAQLKREVKALQAQIMGAGRDPRYSGDFQEALEGMGWQDLLNYDPLWGDIAPRNVGLARSAERTPVLLDAGILDKNILNPAATRGVISPSDWATYRNEVLRSKKDGGRSKKDGGRIRMAGGGSLAGLVKHLTKRTIPHVDDLTTDIAPTGALSVIKGKDSFKQADLEALRDALAPVTGPKKLSPERSSVLNELLFNAEHSKDPTLVTTVLRNEDGLPAAAYQVRDDGTDASYLSYLVGMDKGAGKDALMDAKQSAGGKELWWTAEPTEELLRYYRAVPGVRETTYEDLPRFSLKKTGGVVRAADATTVGNLVNDGIASVDQLHDIVRQLRQETVHA